MKGEKLFDVTVSLFVMAKDGQTAEEIVHRHLGKGLFIDYNFMVHDAELDPYYKSLEVLRLEQNKMEQKNNASD